MHFEDILDLCELKLESKGAPTPSTKATGRGRRDIDDTQNATDAQTFRQAAGTALCMSIDRPSLQFAMSVVMSGSVAGGTRSTMCSATSGRDLAVQIPKQTRKHCMCTRTRIGQRTS